MQQAQHAHRPALHLQALTPLTIGRSRAAASALGALWGFGHSTGQLILGLVFVVLKVCSEATELPWCCHAIMGMHEPRMHLAHPRPR